VLGAAGLLGIAMEQNELYYRHAKTCTRPFTARQAHTSHFSELGEVALHLVLVKTVRYPPEVDNTSVSHLREDKSVYGTVTRTKDTGMLLLSPCKFSPNAEIIFCHGWESTDVNGILVNFVIV
jgi:hypothetical protein